MAGNITHLLVAKEIINNLDNGIINNEGLFYAGSLAPDAIHARKDYMREFKKQTHLREGIRGEDFIKPESLKFFYMNVNNFISNYLNHEDKWHDLYLGYIAHVLTDELFYRTIREEFVIAMQREGIGQRDREFYRKHMKDIDCNNYKLAKEYDVENDIFPLLKTLEPYEIKDVLNKDELKASRNWVINKFSDIQEDIDDSKYIEYTRIIEFIEMAAKDIIQRLSDGIVFKKLF